jgi:hypothetical protein
VARDSKQARTCPSLLALRSTSALAFGLGRRERLERVNVGEPARPVFALLGRPFKLEIDLFDLVKAYRESRQRHVSKSGAGTV